MAKLTTKQEKFVQCIVKGMSQREAYRHCYDTKNMSDKNVDSEASKLFSNPKVTPRYIELMKKVEKDTIMTAQERLEFLTGVVRETEQETMLVTSESGVIRQIKCGSVRQIIYDKFRDDSAFPSHYLRLNRQVVCN